MLQCQEEIQEIPATVVLVAHDDRSRLEAKILRDLPLPFPLLLDTSRQTYANWGLGRTNLFGAMLSPSLNWRYLRLLLRGERLLGFAPDMFQLGGDFVVDPAGRIAFAHRMRNNGDRAPVGQLLDELQRAAGFEPGQDAAP